MNTPEFLGPYDEGNGRDAFGHPVNFAGRCEPINADPVACPPEHSGTPEDCPRCIGEGNTDSHPA
jgi:hypothetical protein